MIRSAIARRLLPRLLAGTLPVVVARRVHEWVRADAELSAAYDALRRVEATERLSAGQLDLLESFILDGATASPQRVRAGVPALVAGCAVAAALLFVVVRPGEDSAVADERIHTGDIKARGVKLASAPLGVKVTCMSPDATRVVDEATAGARQSGARLDCPAGSLLAFSTTNLSKEVRHVFVVGVAAGGSRRFYSPFDETGAALSMTPGVADAPIATLADTANMPRESEVSLFVLVSDEPFSAAELERQLMRAERAGLPLSSVDRLPLDIPVQARIDMHTGGQ